MPQYESNQPLHHAIPAMQRPRRAASIRTFFAVAAATMMLSTVTSQSFANSGENSATPASGNRVASISPETPKAAKPNRTVRNARASLGPTGPSRHSGKTFSGIASFYGQNVGNKTASGQRYNENAMTAAHRTLPFGTKVKVTHRNRSVVVTINDRGPFIRGRVIDLSKGAARVVGLTSRGIGHVVAEVQ